MGASAASARQAEWAGRPATQPPPPPPGIVLQPVAAARRLLPPFSRGLTPARSARLSSELSPVRAPRTPPLRSRSQGRRRSAAAVVCCRRHGASTKITTTTTTTSGPPGGRRRVQCSASVSACSSRWCCWRPRPGPGAAHVRRSSLAMPAAARRGGSSLLD